MTTIQNIIIKKNYILHNDMKIATFDNKKIYLTENKKVIGTFSYEGEFTILTTNFGNGEKFFMKRNDKNIYRQKDLKAIAVSNVSSLGDLARLAVYLYKKNIQILSQNRKFENKQKPDTPSPNINDIAKPLNYHSKKEDLKPEQVNYNRQTTSEKHNNATEKNNSNIITKSNNDSSSNFFICLIGVAFCIAYIIATFLMIPSTWGSISDLFEKKDWLGIIMVIAFFAAGIISLVNLFKNKEPKFLTCITYLLIADVGAGIFSIILSTIFLIFDSNFKFVGLYIIDIPLCILSCISVCFQIAFPIAIVFSIITGITCLIKKYS